MVASPLTVGLPAERMSLSRVVAQMAVVVLASSWVKVGPWRAVSQGSYTQVISVHLSAPVC